MSRLRHLTVEDEAAMSSMCAGLNSRIAALEGAQPQTSLNARMTAAETGITNLAQRLTTDEGVITSNTNRLTALESGTTSFGTWRNNKAAYMGRLPSGEPTGGLLGLGWAAAVNTAISEIRAYLNSKVAPAMETRLITAAS